MLWGLMRLLNQKNQHYYTSQAAWIVYSEFKIPILSFLIDQM